MSEKRQKGGTQLGSGRPKGSKGSSTIRKMAIKTLQGIIEDADSPANAKAIAASSLLQEIPK